jgi:hypothetical protein
MPLVGESIVCFAGEDWWYHNPHSNRHLMKAFARGGNRVLFINSTGIRAPSVLRDRHSWKRIGRKLHSMAIFLRRAESGLFVLTPVALPITRRLRRPVCAANLLLIVAQVRLICAILGMHRPIVWVSSPASIPAAIAMRQRWARLLVYYCVDNIAFFRGADTAFIRSLDLKLQTHADLTFFSGRRLFHERAGLAAETYRLPHGVDYAHFERARFCAADIPADVMALRKPIVGFIGAISSLDVELIAIVAQRNPHVSFVFIGRVQMDMSRLKNTRNVHLLGFKAYTQLPDYLRSFRCCMICYRRGDPFNDYRSPKKLLEYFAAGHPLVSVTLAELEDHAPLVYQANDPEQFHEQLQRALRESDPQLRQQRIEAAHARDWSVVAAEAALHMSRRLALPGAACTHLPQSSA